MKILAFAASSSRRSINKSLVTYAARSLELQLPLARVELLDLNDYELPIYSIDREREGGIPELARLFFDKIGAADALLISYAEHNGFYTSAFKNIFDWASRVQMKVFQDKPMVVMATSSGRNGGANVLKTAIESAPFYGAQVVGSFSLPSFKDSFDLEQGMIKDASHAAQLDQAIKTLALRLQQDG